MSRKGGDIRSFFQKRPENPQPRPASSSTTKSSSTTVKSAASTPAPAVPPSQSRSSQAPTLSSPASSPRTPQKSSAVKPKTLPRNHVVKGSDDDSDFDSGEDSDSSVESLSAIFAKKNKSSSKADDSKRDDDSPSYARPQDTASTPQAKRIASISAHKSPLTLQQKRRRDGALGAGSRGSYQSAGTSQPARHKYDMKALLQHARQSERTEESARRADEEQAKAAFDEGDAENVGVDSVNMQEKARAMLAGDGEDENGEKLVKAIDRTKSRPSRKFCYLFGPEVSSNPVAAKRIKASFPYDATKGRWKFLADPTVRDQAIIHHMPHTLVSQGVKLPDQLLLWILRESCVETNTQLRLRYCDLVVRCGEKAARILTTKELYRILEGLGASKEAQHDEKFSSILEVEDAYEKRDWGPLAAFLRLLADLAPMMSNMTDAILLLLRMSLDPICGTVVRHEHALAMESLIMSSPTSPDQSEEIGNTLASYLNDHVTEMTLRVQAVNSIPKTNPELRALWRNVARGVLFEHSPVRSVEDLNLNVLEMRLKERDFEISKEADFENIKALVYLLDIVVGDGSFLRERQSRREEPSEPLGDNQTITAATTTNTTDAAATKTQTSDPKREADKQFDRTIDTLTAHLEALQNKIHDSNSSERKEAKTALDALAKRLTYSVRTRPPPKRSIFDMHLQREERRKKAEEVEGGRQRDFMKGWTASTSMKVDK